MNLKIAAYALKTLEILSEGGHAAYLVGGCVRDMLEGKPPHDYDAATSARPETVMELFHRTVPTGIKHGTVTVLIEGGKVEVTTFRREEGYSDLRRPDKVDFISELRGDLCRRDFTVNAMAMDIQGNVTDLFGGREDLKARIIRCVGEPDERFKEDALRILRALRFSASLDFELEENTFSAAIRNAGLTDSISAERIRSELEGILCSNRPEFAGLAVKHGFLGSHVPRAELKFHVLRRVGKKPLLRWAAFCAVLEKGVGVNAGEMLRSLRLDRKTICAVEKGLEIFNAGLPESSPGWKRLCHENGIMAVESAAAVGDVLLGGRFGAALRRVLQSGECFTLRNLAINGDRIRDLGVSEGKELGKLLGILLSHVIEHPEDNNYDSLDELARGLIAAGLKE